jgi:hypothetical protein
MNRKDKRRVARLRMEELHAGRRGPPMPLALEPVVAPPEPSESVGEPVTVQAPSRAPSQNSGLSPPWEPGQSGNPDGYSRGRRVADALHRALNKRGLLDDVATTVIAMALGQKIANRTPHLEWFRELRDMIDGPPRSREGEAPDTTEETIDPAVAERLMAAADPGNLPLLEEDEI